MLLPKDVINKIYLIIHKQFMISLNEEFTNTYSFNESVCGACEDGRTCEFHLQVTNNLRDWEDGSWDYRDLTPNLIDEHWNHFCPHIRNIYGPQKHTKPENDENDVLLPPRYIYSNGDTRWPVDGYNLLLRREPDGKYDYYDTRPKI